MDASGGARERAKLGWFGYGRWEAPYWFVGMEPGGNDEPAWYETWVRHGATELMDCRDHHIDTGYNAWHSSTNPSLQPTWIRLIQLLLSYKGVASDLASARAYQRDLWGSKNGETALPEISAIRAQRIDKNVERNAHRSHRVGVIGDRLRQFQPVFAVFYGEGYRGIYETLVGSGFDTEGYTWSGRTLCAIVKHPVARHLIAQGSVADWWRGKGLDIRQRLEIVDATQQARSEHDPFKPLFQQADACQKYDRASASSDNKVGLVGKDVMRLLVTVNPKAPGSKSIARFDCYVDGMTVGEYENAVRLRLGPNEARKCRADLIWDTSHGFIQVIRT